MCLRLSTAREAHAGQLLTDRQADYGASYLKTHNSKRNDKIQHIWHTCTITIGDQRNVDVQSHLCGVWFSVVPKSRRFEK